MKKDDHLVKIASVKLQVGGLKGAKVVYEKTSSRNSRQIVKSRTENNSFPVHNELVELFGSLADYVLDICAYTTEKTERAILLQELEVTGVTAGPSGFVLSATLRVLGSGSKKVISLNTPLIKNETEYGDYEAVTSIIEKIYAETADYMSGRKSISDDQLIMKFNQNDEEFRNVFENMDEDAKKKMATEILAKHKMIAVSEDAVVFHKDEFETSAKDEPETIGSVSEGKVIVMKENVVPSVTADAGEDDPNFDDDELSFELTPVDEPKKSTAKKIAGK